MSKPGPRFFYGWFLAFIAFITILVAYGVRYSFSVFYVEILREFGWSRAATAGMLSLNMFVYGFSGPLAGVLLNCFGPRVLLPIASLVLALGIAACGLASELWQFYLLYGVVAALGLSCSGFVPQTAILSHWFSRYRGTAYGIATAGFGGSFLIGLLAGLLISLVGWRSSYFVVGAIVVFVNIPLLATLARRRPQEMGLHPDGDPEPGSASGARVRDTQVVDEKWAGTEWTLAKALRTRRLWLLVVASGSFWGLAFNMPVAHQVAFFVDVGYGEIFAAGVFGFFGVIHLIGNFSGFLSDRLGREWAYTLGCAGTVFAFLLLLQIRDASQPWVLYLYAIVFGVGSGIVSPTASALYADIFQGRHFAAILGVIAAGMGVAGTLGPWLGGYIHDITGSYFLAFLVAIAAACLACAAVWLAAPRKVRLTGGRAR